MRRRQSSSYSRYDSWPAYVPVAQRREKAAKELAKMQKKGMQVQPVEISGRTIAASFWGKGWCDHMDSFSDYDNRLPRGRTYVRNGSVCHLDIQPGKIEAVVSGTSLYTVTISITPLTKKKWEEVKSACAGKIGSLIDLLRGKLAGGVMEVVAHRQNGLFPLPGEMKFACSCPDWANMCKHVAAVLYGVGARLDHAPEKLFFLRGVNHEELVDVTAAVQQAANAPSSRRRIAATGLADVFGVEMAEDVKPSPAKKGVATAPQAAQNKTAAQPVPEKTRPPGKTGSLKKALEEQHNSSSAAERFPEPLTGDHIRAWRAELGETQAVFAKRLATTAGSISLWEKKGGQELSMFASTLASLHKAWKNTH